MSSPVIPAGSTSDTDRLRPFLKWAGGKRQLLPQLRRFLPRRFRNYHEPFFGSGALFFDLCRQERLVGRRATLVDSNRDLIGCYRAVADNVEAVIAHLAALAAAHADCDHTHYYRIRDERFNPRRRELREAPDGAPYPPDVAAMFIYLNRTGFNGLFRLNSRGEFNVPAGRYLNPAICDARTLRAVASVLQSADVHLATGSFESVLGEARAEDLVYLDPPYAPLSTTARFTSYTAAGFSDADQRQLHGVILELAKRGCHVILSNSTAPLVADLYENNKDACRLRLRAHRVPARRAINSDAARRGDVMELIVTNVHGQG